MDRNNKQQERPESYPRPTETDQQLKNQDEFVEERALYDQPEESSTTSPEQSRGVSESTNNTTGNP